MLIQEAPAQAPTLLPETVVTDLRAERPATSSAADVDVITAEQLKRTGERSLPRAIGRAAGIGVLVQETNLGGGSPMLRGLIGERVLIVVDGVRLNDSTTRTGPNQALNTIDISAVERVELVRGPAAVAYGSDAMGGAILIWTKRRLPDGAGFSAAADAHYESASQGTLVAPQFSWADRDNGLLVSGSLAEWGDLRDGEGEQPFTGYHSNGFLASYNRALGESRMLRLSTRIHRDFDVPRTDRLVKGFGQTNPSSKVFDFDLQESEGFVAEYSDGRRNALADAWSARAFARHYKELRETQGFTSTTLVNEEDDILGYGAGFDFKKGLGDDHLLSWGLDYERDVVRSYRFDTNVNTGVVTEKDGAFADDARHSTYGVYAQDQIYSFAPFDLTLGLRYAHSDFSFDPFGPVSVDEEGGHDALTGSVALARSFGESWRVTGTLSQAYRSPHLDDLAKNAQVFGGTSIGNPELEPEQALTGELAVDYRDELWSGSLGAYHAGISDALGNTLIDAGNPGTLGDETYLKDNVGVITVVGVEARAARRLSDSSPWTIEAGFAFTRGRQFDDTVNPQIGSAPYDDVPARRIPPLHGMLALAYQHESAGAPLDWGRLELLAADKQDKLNPDDLADPRIDPNGTPGWATLDLDLGGGLPQLGERARWSVGLHNLLDQDYRVHGSGLDAPGFNVVLGLSYGI